MSATLTALAAALLLALLSGTALAGGQQRAVRLRITPTVRHAVHRAYCRSRDGHYACQKKGLKFPLTGHSHRPSCYARWQGARWFAGWRSLPPLGTMDGAVLLRRRRGRPWRVVSQEGRLTHSDAYQAMIAAGCPRGIQGP
jgi:hypothetical protein